MVSVRCQQRVQDVVALASNLWQEQQQQQQ
jgi:hypothetical protein